MTYPSKATVLPAGIVSGFLPDSFTDPRLLFCPSLCLSSRILRTALCLYYQIVIPTAPTKLIQQLPVKTHQQRPILSSEHYGVQLEVCQGSLFQVGSYQLKLNAYELAVFGDLTVCGPFV